MFITFPFCVSIVLFLYGPVCHSALKLDPVCMVCNFFYISLVYIAYT